MVSPEGDEAARPALQRRQHLTVAEMLGGEIGRFVLREDGEGRESLPAL